MIAKDFPRIVLASGSPRRHAILSMAGIPHEVIESKFDEDAAECDDPTELVKSLSFEKARDVFAQADQTKPVIVIAADTVVDIGGRILGKPKDPEEAFAMLGQLSGRPHTVHTGVTLMESLDGETSWETIAEETTVYMREFTDDEIHAYVATGEPFDKAGAYAAQEKGAMLIERIEGDFYNVMGLPLVRVYQMLARRGMDMGAIWRV